MTYQFRLRKEPFDFSSEFDEYEGGLLESEREFEPESDEFETGFADHEEEEEEARRGSRAPGSTIRSRTPPVQLHRPPPRRRRPPRTIIRPWRVSAGVFHEPSICTCPEETCPQHGSEYIRWVQSTLNRILGMRLPLNGVLTPATHSAIRSFQEREKLPVTGIVGPDTERALIAASSGQSPGASATRPDEPGMKEPPEPAATPPEPDSAKPAAEFEFEWGSFNLGATQDEGAARQDQIAFEAELGVGETPFGETFFEGEHESGPSDVQAFAMALGAEWSKRRNGDPSPDAMTAWLLKDYQDTLDGARRRWGKTFGAGQLTVEALGRAWKVSRTENMKFQGGSPGAKALVKFDPPAENVALVTSTLIEDSDKAPVAPLLVKFVEELRRRYSGFVRASNYRGHGGGKFDNRGHSLDLFIKGLDHRGFYPKDGAVKLLRAVHEAASAVGAQWRVIYNDFEVADVVNRALGRQHVIFVARTRKTGNTVTGLNWHGPAPLILHFHLDLASLAGGSPSSWKGVSGSVSSSGSSTRLANPNINTPLPRSGPGFRSYKPTSQQYGLPETIQALQAIGSAWQSAHPQGPRIGIGDISLRGGGPMRGHKSHQKGVDVDIGLVRNDGREEPTRYQSPQYSRAMTQELINRIRANGILEVRYIFFNDPRATGVKPWPNHDNHLHVRFIAPGTPSTSELEELESFDIDLANDEAAFDVDLEWEGEGIAAPSVLELKDNIGRIAKREWERWGRGAKHETDPGMRRALRDYWQAGDRSAKDAEQAIDGGSPWSAAFVSYVMKEAGAGDAFRRSGAHRVYVTAAKRAFKQGDASKFWAYDITKVKPEVGDLVCRDRSPRPAGPCGGSTYDNVDDGRERATHCDIVTEVGRGFIMVIGGNTSGPACPRGGCTVGFKKIKLDSRGFVIPDQSRCKYFAVVKPPVHGRAVPSAPGMAGPPPGGMAVPTPIGLQNLGVGLTPPADPSAYRKFRLTTYHVVDQRDLPTGAVRVPIYDDQGRVLAEGSPAFFAQLSLEGTGRLDDDRLINVTGKKVRVSHSDYAEVLEYHRRNLPKKPTTYSGIVVENDRVVRALAFHEVPAARRGIGYGLLRGIPLMPFRTLAADIGGTKKSDPSWKGKGGLVPPGTHVYIKEYDGLRLPGGSQHSGWFVVNDTGGGIFGVHFDVFTGKRAPRKQVKLPAVGTVWFPGIEQRIPPGYDYGLKA